MRLFQQAKNILENAVRQYHSPIASVSTMSFEIKIFPQVVPKASFDLPAFGITEQGVRS